MAADQEKRKIMKQVVVIKNNSIWKKVSYVICSIFIALFLSLFAFIFSHQYFPVTGQSMYPTINANGFDEDGVYVNPFNKGSYGEIIVAKNKSNTTVIKRLLGLEGDIIGFVEEDDGVYYYRIPAGTPKKEYENNLKNYKVIEPYVHDIEGNKSQKSIFENMLLDTDSENVVYVYDRTELYMYKFYKVPEDSIFIMGDNRGAGHTTDSAEYGALPVANIIGKVDYLVKNNYWQVFDIILKIITFKGSNI